MLPQQWLACVASALVVEHAQPAAGAAGMSSICIESWAFQG